MTHSTTHVPDDTDNPKLFCTVCHIHKSCHAPALPGYENHPQVCDLPRDELTLEGIKPPAPRVPRNTDTPKVHEFNSTGEAYNASQVRGDIVDGDVLSVPSEGVVGVLVAAWPIALNAANPGEFHILTGDSEWSALEHGDYTKSVAFAREVLATFNTTHVGQPVTMPEAAPEKIHSWALGFLMSAVERATSDMEDDPAKRLDNLRDSLAHVRASLAGTPQAREERLRRERARREQEQQCGAVYPHATHASGKPIICDLKPHDDTVQHDAPDEDGLSRISWSDDPAMLEFERQYATRSGITVQELRAAGRVVIRCNCGDEMCEGWQSVNRAELEADRQDSRRWRRERPLGYAPSAVEVIASGCSCRWRNLSDEGGWHLVSRHSRCPVHGDKWLEGDR